jgi:molybdopterin/thiamine biosynthesis adenylyltransferase
MKESAVSELDASEYFSQAFARNRGLLSDQEQLVLRNSRVAVAGLGGMGGINVQSLLRIGVGAFHLADIDEFSLVNVNRQIGATAATIGQPKLDVMADVARSINPHVQLKLFSDGVQVDNVREFLADVDVVVDAIDFFCIDIRRLLYRTAREMGKPVVFSAPLGFSGTLHVFSPEGMSFDRYFDIHDGMSTFEQLIAFAVGLAPKGTHLKYMDLSKVSLSEQSGPSIASACNIGAGLLATEVVILLLGRRRAQSAPCYVQFDPYRCQYKRGRLWWGNRGPIQRLKRWIVTRRFKDQMGALEKTPDDVHG